MSILSYTDLQAAISDWLARADLAPRVPDFITLAEARLNRALKAIENQETQTLALVNAAAALPADFQEWIACTFVGATITQDLCFVEADSPEWRFRFRPNGNPQQFTIIAGNIMVKPTATAVGSINFYYYFKLSSVALSNSNGSNWLLAKAPDIYLHTALAEANIYLKDEQRAVEFLTLAMQDADKQSIAADASKFKLDPTRPADTGAGTSRGSPSAPSPAIG